MSSKVVVTGGAGFIGSHLVDALIERNHAREVVVIDNLSTGKGSNINPRARFIKADIRDFRTIAPHFKGADAVFHVAAQARIQPSIADPAPTIETNVSGTRNVLRAARAGGVKRIIYSSSSSIYGDQLTLPLRETMRPKPKNPYAASKLAAERLCRAFQKAHGMDTVILRYFNVYGPRQIEIGYYATVIGIFLREFKAHKALTIVGDGLAERDFTHVADVVRANLLALCAPRVGCAEIINIGCGRAYSINELAVMMLDAQRRGRVTRPANADKLIEPFIGKGLAKRIASRPGESKRVRADIKRANSLLGWRPRISFLQGLTQLMRDAALI